MATLINNLYPPIMPSVIPAFVRNKTCKIYFAISDYNSMKEIANVQITLTNIKTNSSVLNTDLYPTGIKLTTLHYDSHIQGDYCYYIIISPNDLIDKSFKLNEYYKIQMRFTSTNAAGINVSQKQSIAKWLSDNTLFFSEWSRACLLRGISQPILTIDYLERDKINQILPLSTLTGNLKFKEDTEEDYLTEYSVKIYSNSKLQKEGLLFNSGNIHVNLKQQQKNKILCNISYNFESGISYIVKVNYTTRFLYNQQIIYNIKIKSDMDPNPFDIIINTTSNSQNGYIDINIKIDRPKDLMKNKILLRRSSSRNNFKTWEDVYLCEHLFTELSWQDLTIESGVWYKYGIYVLDPNNSILYTPVESQPIMCIFENIFLISNNIQFKMQFNPSVTDFRYNTSESQQLTLGGKFPYIRKNGNNYYRTFSISGLISSLINQTDWYDSYFYTEDEKKERDSSNILFSSKEEIYGGKESYLLYQDYENKNYINNYLNPYYERFFREMIYDFLYSDDVKLFKSPTEGNILIKLTNIAFEPITSLGRVLYSFTATAVEIDDANIANYKKYDILPDSAFVIVTESPQVDGYKNNSSNIILVINADGASQKADQNWILHLETREARGGKLV